MTRKTINLSKHNTLLFPALLFLIILFSSCQRGPSSLPYLGEHETVIKTEKGKEITDTVYYQVPAFSLTDQDSLLFTEDQVKDKVYVSYFFFTSCPSTCPVMTDAMKRIYKVIGNEPEFAVVAHTVDPKRDTPTKLTEFAKKNEIVFDNWHFVTAEEEYMYELGLNGYYLSMGKNDAAPGGFIHSSRFILLDRERHIRGFYEGTNSAEVAKLIQDIEFLVNES